MLPLKSRLIRAAIGMLTLVIFAPFLAVAIWLGTYIVTTPPGIGDVEVAQSKIRNGMSRDEVRSVLGAPHRDRGIEWEYWNDRFLVGSTLEIRFGDDDHVTSSVWWLD